MQRSREGLWPIQRIGARQNADPLELTTADDGTGLPAAPAADSGATRRGLTLHATMMAIVGGELVLESDPDRFTRVRLTVPDAAAFSAPP